MAKGAWGLAVWVWLSAASGAAAQEGQSLSLPEGDALQGRQAFRDLRCYSCHRVSGDTGMTDQTATPTGPPLGLRQARYKTGAIADSIVFPSHVDASGTAGFSRMGDFSDSMTVRQLADLVAFLKQLDDEV